MSPRSFLYRLAIGLVLCFLFANGDVCAQEREEPTIQVSLPNYSYPKSVTSFRQFDIKNSEVIVFGDKDVADFHAHLRRGAYEKHHRVGGDSLQFKWMKFIGNGSPDPEYAIAYYVWVAWAASSSDFGVIQLLRLENEHLKVIQQILFNMRGSEKAGASFNAKSEVLTVRGLNEWEHCCPTGLDVVQFQLKEGLLRQVYFGKVALK